jgi:hypothetical protein
VDLTGPVPKLLRAGAISVKRLREVATLAVEDEWVPDSDDTAAE